MGLESPEICRLATLTLLLCQVSSNCDHGFLFYCAKICTLNPSYTQYTHIHCDQVIVLQYYVVSEDNENKLYYYLRG